MQRVADGEVAEIDLDVFRQVVGEADDVELVQHVVHHAALLLHARGLLGVHEVQRHLHVDLLVLGDTLEVDVLHLRLERMHAHRAQQHLLFRAGDVEREDRGVELLVPEIQVEILVVEVDRDRGVLAAVEDAGDATTLVAPSSFSTCAAFTSVPAVSTMSSMMTQVRPFTSPITFITSETLAFGRRLSMIARSDSRRFASARARTTPPTSGETTSRSS